MNEYTIYADGGCYRNGSEAAEAYGSYVVPADSGTVDIVRLRFPNSSTNNQAEYRALLAALHSLQALARQGREAVITILMDSSLVIHQVAGSWRTKDPVLRSLRNEVLRIMDELTSTGMKIRLEQRPREEIFAVLGH